MRFVSETYGNCQKWGSVVLTRLRKRNSLPEESSPRDGMMYEVHCIPFFYKFHAKENASVSESDVVDATKRCFVLDRRDRTLLSQIQVESDLQISNNFFPFFLAILLSHSVSLVFALLQLFCSYLFMSTMFSIKVRIPQVLIAILINVSFYV